MVRNRVLAILALLSVLVSGLPAGGVLAAPVVSNDNGVWSDTYNDALGISAATNVLNDAPAGIVRVATCGSAANYTTVLIRPTSFDQWGHVALDVSFVALADVRLDILDGASDTPISGYTNRTLTPGPLELDISSINAGTYPSLKVRVNLTCNGSVSPIVAQMTVTWRAISQLQVTKQAVTTRVPAGAAVLYALRYSVSFVALQGGVLWDPLPTATRGTVTYPTNYGQNDEPSFVWASGNGQYWPGPGSLTVHGVSVPAHSVYWDVNNLPSGHTGTASYALLSPNGALSGTVYLNTANFDGDNAAQAQSAQVQVVLTSTPAPYISKRGGMGTLVIDGQTYAGWSGAGRDVQFIVSDPVGAVDGNDYATQGRERMYNSVLYDDLSDMVDGASPKIVFTPGNPCSGVGNISGGGVCNNAYNPPSGGGPIPAVVWNLGTLPPGGTYGQSFEVTLVPSVPDHELTNGACLDSDQTSPVCADLLVVEGIDERPFGIYAKGDDLDGVPTALAGHNDDPNLSVQPGDTFQYTLAVQNFSAVTLNSVVFIDRIPTGVSFVSAAIPQVANGTVFYATTGAYPDPHTPPPIDYTQAPADLDPVGQTNWSATPPADPSTVTWLAYYIPQVSSMHFPPANPISFLLVDFTVQAQAVPDACTGTLLENWGIFRTYAYTPLAGGPPQPITPYGEVEDKELTFVRDPVADLQLNPGAATLTPPVAPPLGQTLYHLTVVNHDTDNADTATNVRVAVQWSPVPVNGVLEYLDFISVTGGILETFDPSNGRVVVNLGTMVPGAQREVYLKLGIPNGVPDHTPFNVAATVTGEDNNLCPIPPGTVVVNGQVAPAIPVLQEVKQDTLDVIPPGGEVPYVITYNNIGHAPSTGTYIFDALDPREVFVSAMGPQGELVYVSNALPPNLPPALTLDYPMDAATIGEFFALANRADGGTPGDPSDDVWTSPYGEATTWIAFLVDDPELGLLPVGVTRQVSFIARNDEDRGPGQVDSAVGTLLFNEAAIVSNELLFAVGNEVRTTIATTPGIRVVKTGPEVVTSGEEFDWTIEYYNDSGTADIVVTVQDTLPDGVTYLNATHTWNAVALANGADPGNNGQPVPSTVVNNPDGTTTVAFNIAAPYRGGNLQSLEGGTITLHVRADNGLPSGTFLLNNVCATASNDQGVVTMCDDDLVEVQNADLWLRKTVDIPDPRAGDTVTWRLLLSNEGPHDAYEVVLQDTLPAGMTYVAGSTRVLTAHYTLGEPYVSGQTLTWSSAYGNAIADDRYSPAQPGRLRGNSEDVLIEFRATVNLGTPPGTTLTNYAETSTTTAEEGVYPNTASAEVRTPYPNPALRKDGPATALPGSQIRWVVQYWNDHNEDAQNAYVVDTLPDYNGDLAVDVTLLNTTASGPGAVAIWYHVGPTAPVPAFNPADPASTGWVSSPAGITVAHLAYSIGLLPRHSGPYDIQITVKLTNPTTGLDLPAGAILPNVAEIFSSTVDEHPEDNRDSATVRTPGLDLQLSKDGSIEGGYPGVLPGTTLVYTVTFANNGTTVAYGNRVVDDLPPEVTFLGDDFTVVALTDAEGQPVTPVDPSGTPFWGPVPVTRQVSGQQITWFLGTTNAADALYYRNVGLPVGSQGQLALQAMVAMDIASGTDLDNVATIYCDRHDDAEPEEEYLANNTDHAATTAWLADLYVEKWVQDAATLSEQWTDPGSVLSYTVYYGNAGDTEAEDVAITEIIPEGTTYVPYSLQLPAGATAQFYPNESNPTSFVVRFAAPMPAPATATGQSDPNWSGVRNDGIGRGNDLWWRLQSPSPLDGESSGPSNILAADFDSDGCQDLVLVTPHHYYRGDCAGGLTLTPSGQFDDISGGYAGSVAADFNGDGSLDLALNAGQSLSGENTLYVNNGDGTFNLVDGGAFDPAPPTGVIMRFLAGDLDGDGDQDIVAIRRTSSSSGNLLPVVLVNNGAGYFTSVAGGDLTVLPTRTIDGTSSDFDQDGDIDILVSGENGAGLYYNNGAGLFTYGGVLSGLEWGMVEGADLNGDNYPDLVNISRRQTSIFLNNGAGTLVWQGETGALDEGAVLPYDTIPPNIAVGDLDGDGDQDIAFHRGEGAASMPWYGRNGYGGYPFVALNDGTGHFRYPQAPQARLTADLGGDFLGGGHVTIVDLHHNGLGTVVLSGNSVPVYRIYTNGGSPTCLQLATGDWTSVPRTTSGSFPARSWPATNRVQTTWYPLDFNQDGWADVIAPGHLPFLNDGTGRLFQQTANGDLPTLVAVPSRIVVVDADNDGDPDIMAYRTTASAYGQSFYRNDSGVFHRATGGGFDAAICGFDATSADFTGDGRPDIALARGSCMGTNQLYRNDGGGTFTLVGSGQFGSDSFSGYAVRAADIDVDGDIDIVINTARVYLNNGAGIFTRVTDVGDLDNWDTLSGFGLVPAIADFTGDGRPDIAAFIWDSGGSLYHLYLFRHDGAGYFTRISAGDLETHPWSYGYLDTADFNHDGSPDLLAADSNTAFRQAVLVLTNDGQGSFTQAAGTSFAIPQWVAGGTLNDAYVLADFDNDSTVDVLANHPTREAFTPLVPYGEQYLYTNYPETGTVTLPAVIPAILYPQSGALTGWYYLAINERVPNGTAITYDILNPATGLPYPNMAGLTADSSGRVSLAGLDPDTVSAIQVRARFAQQDTYGEENYRDRTPQLCAYHVAFGMERTASFSFRVRVNEDIDRDRVDNTAVIGGSTPETDYTNNEAADTIWLRPTDVQVEKTGATIVQAGAAFNPPYTVSYRNNGPSVARNVILTDTLPVGVTYIAGAATPPETHLYGTGVAGDPYRLVWDLGDLAVGQAGSISIPVTAQPSAAGQLVNNVVITTLTHETDYTNNSDFWVTVVGLHANLWVTKECPATGIIGQPISFNVQYGNNGAIPLRVVFSPDTYYPCRGNGGGNKTIYIRAYVSDGSSPVTGVTVDVYINGVLAAPPLTDLGGGYYGGAADSCWSAASGPSGATIELRANRAGYIQGTTSTVVTRTCGSCMASPPPSTSQSGVTVTDTLPLGITYVSANPAPSSVSGQVLTWNNVNAAGGTIAIVGQVDLDGDLVDQYLPNKAAIFNGGAFSELYQSDNYAWCQSYIELRPFVISGHVWNDANANVVREPSEVFIGGVVITLSGTDIFGTPVLATATTDDNGFYSFGEYWPGTYRLDETQPPDWTSTGAVVGTLGGVVEGPDAIGSVPAKALDMGRDYDFGERWTPTAVKLLSFTAHLDAGGGALLAWETATEEDNAGFHLYRSITVNEIGERLNDTMIPSQAPGQGQGAYYEYRDEGALQPGVVYYYTLEDVDFSGLHTPHGPVPLSVWRAYFPLVPVRLYAGPARQ